MCCKCSFREGWNRSGYSARPQEGDEVWQLSKDSADAATAYIQVSRKREKKKRNQNRNRDSLNTVYETFHGMDLCLMSIWVCHFNITD